MLITLELIELILFELLEHDTSDLSLKKTAGVHKISVFLCPWARLNECINDEADAGSPRCGLALVGQRQLGFCHRPERRGTSLDLCPFADGRVVDGAGDGWCGVKLQVMSWYPARACNEAKQMGIAPSTFHLVYKLRRFAKD